MKSLFMYSNVCALSVAYVVMIVDPSWVAVSAALGWTAAWYYHYTACVFIKQLVDDGVIDG